MDKARERLYPLMNNPIEGLNPADLPRPLQDGQTRGAEFAEVALTPATVEVITGNQTPPSESLKMQDGGGVEVESSDDPRDYFDFSAKQKMAQEAYPILDWEDAESITLIGNENFNISIGVVDRKYGEIAKKVLLVGFSVEDVSFSQEFIFDNNDFISMFVQLMKNHIIKISPKKYLF